MKDFVLLNDDMLKALDAMPANSVDAVITDPPYELGFMGNAWDNTGITFSAATWKKVLRVLKPGGHLLAFNHSRMSHRMVVAIEDAGFEIRDTIMWVYGSGFPKSHNIGLAIDKKNKVESKVIGDSPNARPNSKQEDNLYSAGTVGKEFKIKQAQNEWEGWGTALKPAYEPITLARKPLGAKTIAANVLKYGVGGINIDESRVPGEPTVVNKLEKWSGFGQEIEPDYEQEINTSGRFPANLIHDGSEEVLELFPHTKSGKMTAEHTRHTDGSPNGIYGKFDEEHPLAETYGDEGSAARFFYCAKANKSDRGDNSHPTVKPTDLMQYLVRLITPKGGVVLDPFMGSGSTGKAVAILNSKENRDYGFIGIELEKEYYEIATKRIQEVK